MAIKLFTVSEVFSVVSRGTFLLPGAVRGERPLRIGDLLELRRPDQSVVRSAVDGLDVANPGRAGEIAVLVALPRQEVPVGTEVWSV